jgi:CDP-glycerol glycerophosphotransferase (TagB/SpsB family)
LHRVCTVPSHIEKLSNIRILDNEIDIYPLLPLTDCLITDYSSVCFDYALLRKPIIFYPFDYDDYCTNSRHLYFNYTDIIKHNICYTFVELKKKLSQLELTTIPEIVFFDNPRDFLGFLTPSM